MGFYCNHNQNQAIQLIGEQRKQCIPWSTAPPRVTCLFHPWLLREGERDGSLEGSLVSQCPLEGFQVKEWSHSGPHCVHKHALRQMKEESVLWVGCHYTHNSCVSHKLTHINTHHTHTYITHTHSYTVSHIYHTHTNHTHHICTHSHIYTLHEHTFTHSMHTHLHKEHTHTHSLENTYTTNTHTPHIHT